MKNVRVTFSLNIGAKVGCNDKGGCPMLSCLVSC